MRKLLALSALLFCCILTGYGQEYVNKIMKYSDDDKRLRLDYIENTENDDGEMVTRLYMKFIPRSSDSEYFMFESFSELMIRDRKRGNYYDVKGGSGISVRYDAHSMFHTQGGEIGFSLDFEPMTDLSIKNFELHWGKEIAFSNIAIDPEKDNVDDPFFRFKYTYTTISFYTNVPNTGVYFTVDGKQLPSLALKPRTTGTPSTCSSSGTVTFIYNREVRKEINFNIKAYSNGTSVGEWRSKAEPSFGCKFLSLKK